MKLQLKLPLMLMSEIELVASCLLSSRRSRRTCFEGPSEWRLLCRYHVGKPQSWGHCWAEPSTCGVWLGQDAPSALSVQKHSWEMSSHLPLSWDTAASKERRPWCWEWVTEATYAYLKKGLCLMRVLSSVLPGPLWHLKWFIYLSIHLCQEHLGNARCKEGTVSEPCERCQDL